MTYAAGNVVVLKSGGPAMTVVSSSDDEIEVVWFGEASELYRQSIPAIALEPVDDEEDDDEDEDDDEEEDEELKSKKKKKEFAD